VGEGEGQETYPHKEHFLAHVFQSILLNKVSFSAVDLFV
jgi:hypothetical protein